MWWEVIWEKLMFKMLWNTHKDGLCYLRNESVPWKISFWTCTKYERIIVSTLGQVGRVEVFPKNTNPFARIALGYIAEGRGEHYVTLADLNEVGSENEVDIMGIDNSAVENIENKNEYNNLENLSEENINLEQLPLGFFCQLWFRPITLFRIMYVGHWMTW